MSKIYRNSNKTSSYKPSNYEQAQIKKIGISVGEEDLGFLLAIYRDFGFLIIEDAYNILKEKEKNTKINNKPAYLNKIIQNLKTTHFKKD